MQLIGARGGILNGPEFAIYMVTLNIVAGLVILWMAMNSRRHIREMQHRERLAMIERGLVPSPETDPGAFERRTGLGLAPDSQVGARSRSSGVILIGIGLGLMMLISFAAEAPGTGIGVGGAFALLGVAFYINGVLSSRQDVYRIPSIPADRPSSDRPAPPSGPS
jgi:hypothetical protein